VSTKLKYPYRWGREPVNAFVEKYPRGTYFLGKLLSINPGEVRHYLVLTICSGNSLKYEAVKRVIKVLEGYSAEDINKLSVEDRKLLYKYLVWFGQDETLDGNFTKRGLDSFRS